MSTEAIANRIDKNVTSELAMGKTGNLSFANLGQIMEVAKVMAIAQQAIPKHLRDNVGACLAVAITASEWEMSPFAVANKTYVVNDRLGYEAQLVAAVILKRAPIKGRIKYSWSGEGGKRKCKVWAVLREDDEVVEYESPEFDKIPVKNSPLWKSDPDQQQAYFSVRSMCRRHFPDVLLGIYTPEEMQESDRDVTPSKPTFTQEPSRPKHLGGITLPEPANDPPPAPEPPAAVEPEPSNEEAPSYTEEQRLALLDEVNEARDSAGLSMEEFKKRVSAQGWAGPKDMVNKYSAETLVKIRDGWSLIVPSGE